MKKIIHTHHAPAPIGPYSQAVRMGNTVYTSGQIAIDAKTGLLIQGSISDETHQVMRNMQAVLEAAGLGFEHVLKSTIFITNMDDFGAINDVYASYFDSDHAPARETVQVARLPKDVRVEISMIAAD
ncbi:MAG: RidA family protein [Bacteroidetes bacterium]|jgi:2-iminobutanoate/2-iminopropanoate deaminase|nr:RidA family protein [Bacteroidota bacterium]HCK05164.1 reactive intermediate/imine deaminase [Flavobacteriaceae bacterium]